MQTSNDTLKTDCRIPSYLTALVKYYALHVLLVWKQCTPIIIHGGHWPRKCKPLTDWSLYCIDNQAVTKDFHRIWV